MFNFAHARGAGLPAVSVEGGSVLVTPVPNGQQALGEVDSLGKTTLVAPTTGEIIGPFQTEGEIAAGTVIARNVPPTLKSSIASTRADVAMTQTVYAQTRQLAGQRLTTQMALDRARRDLVHAKEKLNGLREEAEQDVIKAPFAGTLHYLISPESVVYKGTPIATLSGRAIPWIDARVPPETARDIRPGEAARIVANGWSGIGHVVSVGRDARPLGLVLVRIRLPDGNPLIPGQWAWVRLIRPGHPAPTVASSAVVMRSGRNMVFVLRGGIAHAIPVRVLAEQNGRAWLAGSLHAGEQVAVRHAARLADDSRVIIRPDSSFGTAR